MPKIIKGSFKRQLGFDDEPEQLEPAAGEIVTLRLSQQATVIATGAKVGGGDRPSNGFQIELDENGEIPAGTEILGNDEVLPHGTFYEVELSYENAFGRVDTGERWVVIAGQKTDITTPM